MKLNSKRSAEFTRITPPMAAMWLGKNLENNRKARDWHVEELAESIQNNEWEVTHQGIAFDKNGKLIDGQHRLQAIVASGVPVTMLVVRGLEPTTFGVIDSGMKRTLADRTGLDQRLAEVCRLFYAITNGHKAVSAMEANKIANTEIGELHGRLIAHCPRHANYFSSAPNRVAAITLILNGADEQKVFDSYARMVYMKFGELTPIESSLVKQVTSGVIKGRDKREIVVRGIKCMDPKNARYTKLVMTENDHSNAIELVKKTVKKLTGEI